MTDDRPQSDKEWKARLAPEQYRVLRRGGTETPFTGLYNDCHDPGVYRCAACHAALFDADDKFDSGTGWPSFVAPAQDHSVSLQRQGLILRRTEVRCATCDSHLGHVFADGPRDRGGQRYCINSAALDLDPAVRVSGSPGSRTEQLVMARSILICDDTEQVRRLMVAILRPGYDLREAVDGEAALDAAAAHRPDLVILDLHMPGLDGLAVLARLREDPRLADVRVMLLSGGAEALDASWAEQVGADGQLAKPFRAEDLTGAVRSLLDG